MSNENNDACRPLLDRSVAEEREAAKMSQARDARKHQHVGDYYQPVALEDIHDSDSGDEVDSRRSQENRWNSSLLIDHLKTLRQKHRSLIYIIIIIFVALVLFLYGATR
jgi:hypothetical protein